MKVECSRCKIEIVYTSYKYDTCAGKGFTDKTLCCHCAFQKMLDREQKLANNPQRERPSDTGRAWHFLSVNGCMQCNFRAKVDEPNFFQMRGGETLRKKLEAKEKEIQEHEAKIEFFANEIMKYEEEIAALRKEHEQFIKDSNLVADGFEEQRGRCEELIKNLRATIEQKEGELERLRGEHARHTEELERMMSEKEGVTKRLNVLRNKWDEEREVFKKYQADLQNVVNEQGREIEKLTNETNRKDIEYRLLQVRMATEEGELRETVRGLNSRLMLFNESSETMRENLEGRISRLELDDTILSPEQTILRKSISSTLDALQTIVFEKISCEDFNDSRPEAGSEAGSRAGSEQSFDAESEASYDPDNLIPGATRVQKYKVVADLQRNSIQPLSRSLEELVKADSRGTKEVFKIVLDKLMKYSAIMQKIDKAFDESTNYEDFHRTLNAIKTIDVRNLQLEINPDRDL